MAALPVPPDKAGSSDAIARAHAQDAVPDVDRQNLPPAAVEHHDVCASSKKKTLPQIKSLSSKPTMKSKITFQAVKRPATDPPILPKREAVAAAFNEDSSSEDEEIPFEARLRMRNVGRDTKTASGPNSFNKGKHGFSDPRSWERLQQNSPAIKDSGDVGKKPEES